MAGPSVLSASVGAGGGNAAGDVGLVQILLNVMRGLQKKPLLAVDGVAGPLTIAAIKDFQTQFSSSVDGRIDPTGPTIRRLIFAYITTMRIGVDSMKPFPPSFAVLAAQERPSAASLGEALRIGLTGIKQGITPFLKATAAPPRPKPSQPVPEPPRQQPGRVIDIS